MRIEIKKDHPLTLVGFLFLGLIASKLHEGIEESNLVKEAILLVFLLFLIAAYLIQIRQTIILEEGKITFIERKKKYELLVAKIVSVSRKGGKLNIRHQAGELEMDTGWFSKKQVEALLSHVAHPVATEARERIG